MQQQTQEVLEEVLSEEKTLSIYNLIMDGGIGGQLIIGILLLMLIVALYIYFERIFAINAVSKTDNNFMNQIKDQVVNGKLDAAKVLCAQTNSPEARLIEKGISRIGKKKFSLASIQAFISLQKISASKISTCTLDGKPLTLKNTSPPSA